MAKVLVTEGSLSAIGAAIRNKLGVSTTYKPGEMAAAIGLIHGEPALQQKTVTVNGDVTPDSGYDGLSKVTVAVPPPTLVSKSITVNGAYPAANENADGFSNVSVNVPNTYAAADEGKVVQNGALAAQTSRTVAANGTYDTTVNGEVVVNVQPNLQSKIALQNGIVTPDSGYDGLSSVEVQVSGGGGSAYIESWDLTDSFTGEQHGIVMSAYNTVISAEGVVFDDAKDYLMIPISWNGITIEVDVAAMNLESGNHRRFIMASDANGFIYRSTGVWAFYNGSWVESNETDGSFFDGCTVKVIVDANGYWHVYKDGVLWWEPGVTQTMSGTTRQIRIGSSANSINNATITGVRLS